MLWNQVAQKVELGWDFYLPVILFVALIALAVPVWAVIGAAAIAMLYLSGDLPMSLVGASLFSDIDAFALSVIPLFILTGDVLVRKGLFRKFLDVAKALTNFAKGGFGSATVLVCGIFSGKLTPTEAGATAVVVTILMGFIMGTLRLADFPAMLVSSAKVSGVILPIIAIAAPLAEALAIMGVLQGFVTSVTSLTNEPWILILLMIGLLIAAGCVMETTLNIVILAPILRRLPIT